jgi:hypothetical protein
MTLPIATEKLAEKLVLLKRAMAAKKGSKAATAVLVLRVSASRNA